MKMKTSILFAALFGISTSLAAQEADSTKVKTKHMKEVTIAGVKRQVVYRLDRSKIDAQQVLSAAGGSAVDILTTLPSVQADADGEISLRGSSNFLVYIDGKLSPLEGTQALRMIPASTIQDIEILTTPGARYQTQGDVGIINITTIKGKGQGLSGLINAKGSTLGSWGGDGRIDWQKGKQKWWASMQADRYRGASDFRQEKTTIVDNITTTSHADGDRFRTQKTLLGTVGWQYTFNQKHQLNADIQSGEAKNGRGGDMDYMVGTNDYDAHDRYMLTKRLVQLSADWTWNINERGDRLFIQSRNRYDWHSMEYTESNLFDLSGTRFEGTRGYEHEHHWDCDEALNYKMQYRPTGAFEAGYQYVTYSEIGDYNIKYWDRPRQQFEWQDDLHAPFDYHRQIHSLYAMASDHFGPWEAEAGVRMDQVRDKMDISVANASRDIHRTEFYPSAHVGHTSEIGTFVLGYARRVNRPGIWKLEPYITYEDYYTKIIGNPDIAPEYIQSLELSYRKSFKGGHSISVTGYQRWMTDVVDIIRRPYEPGVTLDSIINAGDRNVTGLEFSGVVKANKWWTTTANGHLNHYDFNATYEGCTDISGMCFAFSWINQFNITPTTKLQFDSHYVGPHHLTQGKEKAYCFFDLAAKQDLFKGRMTVSLSAHDVFRTARFRNWRTMDDLRSDTWVKPHYPNVTLNVSWRFNTQPKEKAQKSGDSHAHEAVFEGKDF